MKKLILLFVILFGITELIAQRPIEGIDENISVGGMFENVFDQYGNKFSLKDIIVNTPKKSKLNNTSLSSTLLCTSGIFELYFETGSGMEVVADPVQNNLNSARRAVACQVFTDLSNFINSPLKTVGNNTKVKIWVRDISEVVSSTNGVLGLATSFYSLPYNTTTGFGGIADNEIWKTIHAGKDSYINVAPPIISNGVSSGVSGLFYHGMMTFNFKSVSNWNTNLNINTPAGQIDLYSVILHEVTHALGFASLINQNGISKLGTGYNYFTRYDRFLKNNSNSQFLINTPTSCSMYNYRFNPSLSTTILRPSCTLVNNINTGTPLGTTICGNALRFVGATINVPIYTPVCYEQSSSYSHFEDMCIGVPNQNNSNSYFVMTDAMSTGQTKRFLKPEERNALGDIGYQLNTTFGNNTIVFGSYKDYGGLVTTGVNVAGINDGIEQNAAYSFSPNVGGSISISNILSNDYNATAFECLQDVFSSSTIYPISGSSTTNITFSSIISGLHLLRYVPINALGQKGNISYIYVYVKPNNPVNYCTPTPSSCDLVMNGNFSEKLDNPSGISQINYSCGWSVANGSTSTPDYFNSDAESSLVSIPCNFSGYQSDYNSLNGYAGMLAINHFNGGNSHIFESIKTRLKSPLLPDTKYQLSFKVSLAEGRSSSSIKMQAYLAPTDIPPTSSGGEIPIANNAMLFENNTFSSTTNDWETITFVFTTSSTAGEQYLYLGGLKNVQFQTRIPDINNSTCNYSSTSNYPPYSDWGLTYYYIDNVSLIPVEVEFTLPSSVCLTQTLSNLNSYVSPQMQSGTFSGSGVTLSNDGIYSFNANTAGLGIKTLTYTYTNNLGCLVNVYSQITVSDCSSASCPGNLVFDNPQIVSLATYQASNTIITNNNYIVNIGTTINLKAGNSITFSPMSEIKSGSSSNFTAQIGPCIQTSARIANDSNMIKENIEVQIYPNPFDKIFNIKIVGDELSKVTIVTMEGKTIFNVSNIQSDFYDIESDSMQKGVYIVYIETKNGLTFNKKIIKN